MEDVMLHFSDNAMSQSILSKSDLMERCSMAFKSAPTNPAVSSRYLYANTEQVIDDLEKLGWYPVDAKQCRPKAGSKGIRSFHMIAFQNPNVKIVKDGTDEVECYPRIILTNSHDGFNSFKFMVGLFRLICSNGLVIATDKMVELKIRHMNYTFDELRKLVASACEKVQIQTGIMTEMSNTILTQPQKIELAKSAIKIRKGIPAGEDFKIDDSSIDEILETHRTEDEGDSLWNVFNVIQENMMKGGYSLKNANGKVRKQRPIKSVSKSLDVNVELFKSASQYLPLAA